MQVAKERLANRSQNQALWDKFLRALIFFAGLYATNFVLEYNTNAEYKESIGWWIEAEVIDGSTMGDAPVVLVMPFIALFGSLIVLLRHLQEEEEAGGSRRANKYLSIDYAAMVSAWFTCVVAGLCLFGGINAMMQLAESVELAFQSFFLFSPSWPNVPKMSFFSGSFFAIRGIFTFPLLISEAASVLLAGQDDKQREIAESMGLGAVYRHLTQYAIEAVSAAMDMAEDRSRQRGGNEEAASEKSAQEHIAVPVAPAQTPLGAGVNNNTLMHNPLCQNA
mmetsp:Transcript_20737/g.67158  ORF Transcript_20737/g.67158 Transcript_20737/m.67158 type:complete len:279 (+) Transcript_20737:1-837(+)